MIHAQGISLLSLVVVIWMSTLCESVVINVPNGQLSYQEKWGYSNVRPNAYMFWWLYYSTDQSATNRPLIMWLQLLKGDLIFVDNPVGTGFSYVTQESALTKDVAQIAEDLLTLMQQFFVENPQYQKRPFYIMSESYGGKMTAAFGDVLYKAMVSGKVLCNLKGVGLGDSWISPIDFVMSWGNYLYYLSYLSDANLMTYNNKAAECKHLVDTGAWFDASNCWDQAEVLVGQLTDDVSWYNVLKRSESDPWSTLFNSFLTPTERLYQRHMVTFGPQNLGAFMNGPIKQKLGIIPANVSWGGQGGKVFSTQMTDFMKPVVSIVDDLLANTTLKVVIYNGQLDLICDTVGVEMWLKKLTWSGMGEYRKAKRTPFHAGPPPTNTQTAGFYKQYKNLHFFWIMRAGHMVPADAPYATRRMMDIIMTD